MTLQQLLQHRFSRGMPAWKNGSRELIAIIILFFALCWFPLLGYYISVRRAFLRDLGGVTYMWIRTLVLSNSSMNFIVYSCRIEHFRVAYLRIINRMLRNPRKFWRRTTCNAVDVSRTGKVDNDSCVNGSKDCRRTTSSKTINSCSKKGKDMSNIVDQGICNDLPLELMASRLQFDTRHKNPDDTVI